ncbi:MAG TPA: radical SAM protein [Syntrophomonadaceae bacterium]|nr:radical SAM protein [Syntrophomonadaceae bacterium]
MHVNIPIFMPQLGCPFHCLFCDQQKISSQHQVPGMDETVDTIEQHLATIPPDADTEIAFFGGNFTSLPVLLQEQYLNTVKPFLESGQISSLRVSTRPDCIDQVILRRLRSYGVKTVELGVQSLNDNVLQRSGRGYKAEQVLLSCQMIKDCGLQLGIQLMVGLPGDNLEADLQTIDEVIKLNPAMVRIYPTLVIEGTALEHMYQQGDYTPLVLNEAVKIVALMYMRLQFHKIKVIRMGLQPSEDLLKPGTVVAGPFHPAFGELVEQEVYRLQAVEAINKFISNCGSAKRLVLFVNSREVSKLVGCRRSNLNNLSQYFNLDKLSVRQLHSNNISFIGVASDGKDSPELTYSREEFLAAVTNSTQQF